MKKFSSSSAKFSKAVIFTFLMADGLFGCASAPKPEIKVLDSYQFNLSSKSGVSSWQKTLNKGLCQVQVNAQFDKAYTQSAREADAVQETQDSMSIPFIRLSLMGNAHHSNQQKTISLTAQYDADSSQVQFYLSHANGSGEYLPYTTRLQQAFSIHMQPFDVGDIGLNVTDAVALNPSADKAAENEQDPVKYHAYPEFLAQKVLLEVFASDVEVSLLDVVTGCE